MGYKLIETDFLGWIEIEDKGEVQLFPKNWFSATRIKTVFGTFGILITATAAEAKEQTKRRIKRKLVEVPNEEMARIGVKMFRPVPDPFKRPIPSIKWSKEAFNSVLINNAFMSSQFDKMKALQLAYLKNLYGFSPSPSEGMARLNQATQMAAQKRILQKAYANYVPNLTRNEAELLILAAKTGAVGAASGCVTYFLIRLVFSPVERQNTRELVIKIRAGFNLDPASLVTGFLFKKGKELVGNLWNGTTDQLKEKLDLGSILENLGVGGGEKRKEKKRLSFEFTNPVVIAVVALVGLGVFIKKGGKIEELPGVESVVTVFSKKKSMLEILATNVKWLYNPTQIQGWIAIPTTTVIIYFTFQFAANRFPGLRQRPLDAFTGLLELTKSQFDKLTNMFEKIVGDSNASLESSRTESIQRAEKVQKVQAQEIANLKDAIKNGQSENSALKEIYGEAQLTSTNIQNSLNQCRNDVRAELGHRAKSEVYQKAVSNTQEKLLKGNEIVSQESFALDVQNQLKNTPINTAEIDALIDTRYPSATPLPPVSDALRDQQIKIVHNSKALDAAKGGKILGK
jgi:hypothetical protein